MRESRGTGEATVKKAVARGLGSAHRVLDYLFVEVHAACKLRLPALTAEKRVSFLESCC